MTVTDKSGNGIGDVNVAVNGPVDRSGRTAADGSVAFRTMRAGTYRLRFENERYITLEREVVVGARASDVSVALNPAPVPKPVVAPPRRLSRRHRRRSRIAPSSRARCPCRTSSRRT